MFYPSAVFLLCAALASSSSSSVAAFAPPSTGSHRLSTTARHADAYSYTYGGAPPPGAGPPSGNGGGGTRTDESRVSALEQAVEKRLAALTERERALESRLRAVEGATRGAAGPVRGPAPPGDLRATGPVADMKSIQRIWDTAAQTRVQGGSLRTWSFANPNIERVHVLMKTDGRPLDADIDLWQGPDNTPHRMRVYVEDGALRTFSAFIDTPGTPNTIAVRNIGHLEFPLDTCVGSDLEAGASVLDTVMQSKGETVQGGALRTYGFDPSVDSVAILLVTDGRPLNSRIELLQGPNNNKQVIELYTEDGMERPFLAVFQTPGSGNVVRVVNTAPVEFPLVATVVAYEVGTKDYWNQQDGVMMGSVW